MPDVGTLPIVMIAAVARNGAIGRDNTLLWRLKSDMAHFRARTMGRPVLMGRKTGDSIGRPLPGREIVVVTRDAAFAAAGVHVAHDIDTALALAGDIAARLAASGDRRGGRRGDLQRADGARRAAGDHRGRSSRRRPMPSFRRSTPTCGPRRRARRMRQRPATKPPSPSSTIPAAEPPEPRLRDRRLAEVKVPPP